jgi:mannose-1-phosphate guanylyltransferase
VNLDGDGSITGFIEKPPVPSSDLANGGVYVMSAEAYREIAGMNGSDLAHEILPAFVGRMRGWLWEGYHRDIGTLASLKQAEIEAAHVFASRAGGGR